MPNLLTSKDIESIYKKYENIKGEMIQDIRSDEYGQLIENYIQQLVFCLMIIPKIIKLRLLRKQPDGLITIDKFFQLLLSNEEKLEQNLYTIFTIFAFNSKINDFEINSVKLKLLLKTKFDILDVKIKLEDLKYLHNARWSELTNFILSIINLFGDDLIDIFSVIYERDLSSIDRLTDKSDDHKINRFLTERRKKGVFYTPKQITAFMNKLVIHSFLRSKSTPSDRLSEINQITSNEKLISLNKALSEMKLLDLACGSGDFLIDAAQQIFEIQALVNEKLNLDASKFEIKKQIIENNLVGVDLQNKAISLTKIRLWLWMISDVNEMNFELIELAIFKFNLFVGNSLIGWDCEYESSLNEENSKDDLQPLKPFNWKNNFKEIFSNGGFDIIVSNPPYLEIKKVRNALEKSLYKQDFISAYKIYDISILFLERAINLLKEDGFVSFIITNKFISSDFGQHIREFILTKTKLKSIYDVSYVDVFEKISTYPVILLAQKSTTKTLNENLDNKLTINYNFSNIEQLSLRNYKTIEIPQKTFYNLPKHIFDLSGNTEIVTQIMNNPKAISLTKFGYFKYRIFGFIKWQRILKNISKIKSSNMDLRFIGTANINSYFIDYKKDLTLSNHRFNQCYHQYTPNFDEQWMVLTKPKLLFKEINKKLAIAFDGGFFSNATGIYMFFPLDESAIKPLLLILNSKLMNFLYDSLYRGSHLASEYLRYNGSYLKELPIIFPKSKDRLSVMTYLCDYQLFINQLISNYHEYQNNNSITEMREFFLRLANMIIYELYFFKTEESDFIQELKNNLLSIKFDEWFSLLIKERLSKEELNVLKLYEKESLDIVTNCKNKLTRSPIVQECFEKISSNRFVKAIE
ncbi:MAG: N-6 DNA methylase [Asgard group archaeon]|nr:N-6 DNA methylase [Asgard group archaeon]